MNLKYKTLLSAAALMVAIAIPLLAHMHVQKTEPATDSIVAMAPKVVQVWFDQTPAGGDPIIFPFLTQS